MVFRQWVCRGRADGPQHCLEFVDPLLAMLLEFVEAPCLEALEDLGVCSLGLTVAVWVSNGGITDLRAHVGIVGVEQAAGELRAIVGDDAVRHAEAANQALDEFHRKSRRDVPDWLHFCPLREFVGSDIELAVAPDSSQERSQNVEPPDRKRPREGDGLKSLSGLVHLLGVELARLVGLDELGGVLECGGPVEAIAESLAHECAR